MPVATDDEYVILATSRAGKIFALNVADAGTVMWNFSVPARLRVGFKWISLSLSLIDGLGDRPLLVARATSFKVL